jgi:putative ATP-dependent endonuclease of OLD family
MRLTEIKLKGFRNLSTTVAISHPLALIVGENNVGKSNVVDAIRLALLCETGQADNRCIQPEDFAHEGTGQPVVDEFTIELLFTELDEIDQGRLHAVRAPAFGTDAAILGARGVLEGPNNRPILYSVGGEDLAVEADAYARRSVQYTCMPALRDATSDLRPGPTNRLKNLLSSVIAADYKQAELVNVMLESNKNLKALEGVQNSEDLIRKRLDRILGPTFRQVLELAFADPRFDRIVGGLRALVGTQTPLEVRDNGLGYNNLLYISVLLAVD